MTQANVNTTGAAGSASKMEPVCVDCASRKFDAYSWPHPVVVDDPAQPVDHILDKIAHEIATHPMKKRNVYALLCRVYQMGKNSMAVEGQQ